MRQSDMKQLEKKNRVVKKKKQMKNRGNETDREYYKDRARGRKRRKRTIRAKELEGTV